MRDYRVSPEEARRSHAALALLELVLRESVPQRDGFGELTGFEHVVLTTEQVESVRQLVKAATGS